MKSPFVFGLQTHPESLEVLPSLVKTPRDVLPLHGGQGRGEGGSILSKLKDWANTELR